MSTTFALGEWATTRWWIFMLRCVRLETCVCQRRAAQFADLPGRLKPH